MRGALHQTVLALALFTALLYASGYVLAEQAIEPARVEPGTALLQVDAPGGSKDANTDADWQRTIATHATLIAESGMLRDVLQSDDVKRTTWFKSFDRQADAEAALKQSLSVSIVPGTSLLSVRVGVQPRADAVVLTNILCDTYVEHRANERRVHLEKAVELLTKQKKIYENELNEEIIKSLREHEYALGGAAADPAAMIQQLDTVELSEAEKRSAAVAEKTATEEARITPSAAIEIEAGAMPQVKELRVELRRIRLDLAEAAGDRADALRRRREACEKMLAEETTKALKLTLDVHVQRADAAIAAAQREIQLIQEKRKALTESAATLRSLNSQYAVLQSHEQDMREKIRRSRDEIMRLTQSIIGAKFNSPVRLVALAS